MTCKKIILCLVLCCSHNVNAESLRCEGVTLSLNDQSARANISIVEGIASDAEIDEALQMHGNLALIEKSNQTGASNTVDDLRTALRSAREGADAIRALLSQPPTAFFQRYRSLCHANKGLLCFSPTTDSIIEQAAGLLR